MLGYHLMFVELCRGLQLVLSKMSIGDTKFHILCSLKPRWYFHALITPTFMSNSSYKIAREYVEK